MFREQVFRRTQDLRRSSGLVDEHKELFRWKKSSAALKLTSKTNSVQQHVRLVFANSILFGKKIILSPYSSCLLMLANSV